MKGENKNQSQKNDQGSQNSSKSSNSNKSNKEQGGRGSNLTQEDRIRGGEHSHGGSNQGSKDQER